MLIQLLEQEGSEAHSMKIINTYRDKRDFFNQQLNLHFHDLAEWHIPKGGLFFWLTLKKHITMDTLTLFNRAIRQGVAFMPGTHFYTGEHSTHNTMRLNFSNASNAEVAKGLKILAKILRQDMQH